MRPSTNRPVSDPERLLSALDEAVARLVEPFDEVAVAYSGGLDSSIIAALASRRKPIKCYCACAPSSYDESNVRSFASQDGLEAVLLEMADDEIIDMVRLAKTVRSGADAAEISFTIPCLCVLERSPEQALIVGSGADELFAGYAKYESVEDVEGEMKIDLKKALYELDILQDYALKRHRFLLAPYAHDRVLRVASDIPMSRKLGPEGRKLVLRDCARLLGLSAGDRPKKAAQYSSGVHRRMRQLAKASGMTVSDWVREV
jgi:asparagine synthase (glutamine-hydrolysing)